MDAVERHLTLPTDLDEAWALLTRPEDLAGWLGAEVVLDPTPGAEGLVVDHDGTRRRLTVDRVDDAGDGARTLAWRWWVEGDDGEVGTASRVELTLVPALDGTLLTVTERPEQPAAATTASASAAWSHRLLHLEALLLVAAAVRGVISGADPDRVAGAVFAALADPTRRAVLREVAAQGPVTATELAARVPVTRQAITKHLGVLAEAGLVTPSRSGRENRFTATPTPLADAERWLRDEGRAWDDRLARLEARLRTCGPSDGG